MSETPGQQSEIFEAVCSLILAGSEEIADLLEVQPEAFSVVWRERPGRFYEALLGDVESKGGIVFKAA